MQHDPHSVQVVGVVRFSVLTEDYYAETHGSVEAIGAHLFNDERLALRFRLFETLCLPSLVAQADQDFNVVVLTSTHLPPEARERLDALIAPHDNITIFAADPARHYQICKQAYASAFEEGYTHRLCFRLDDDDAVSRDYVARCKRLAGPLLAIEPDAPTMIAFNRGFYVEVTGEGGNSVIDTVERAPLSVGLALLHPVSYGRNPYRYNHRAIAQHYTLYSDVSEPCFIRTIHSDNKSSPAKLGITGKMEPNKIESEIGTRFGFDIKTLRDI
ncbi:putative rhamnosyl transferase [Lentibacter algarum]|uniref:glycosyltransferase n=1 Tax=Lentibacter algarum TaxID=576131 RepID=UPI001C076A0F|nr:glycosyltransferase [Lentibacter algarum]MBU2981815.1 putative rhamnosyl transferase [Lentibacter algarum]